MFKNLFQDTVEVDGILNLKPCSVLVSYNKTSTDDPKGHKVKPTEKTLYVHYNYFRNVKVSTMNK